MDSDFYQLKKSDMSKALNILTCAFLDYPFPGSLISDSEKRKIVLYELFKIEYKRGLHTGANIALSDNFCEVSIWRDSIMQPSMFSYYCIYSSLSSIRILTNTTKDELNKIKDANYNIMSTKKSLNLPPNTAELYAIGVDPNYQGQGRAGRLLQAGIEHYATQNKHLLIMTNTQSNVSFYKKYHFKIIKEQFDKNNNIISYFLFK